MASTLISTRRFIYTFAGLLLLFSFHNVLPKWNKQPAIRDVNWYVQNHIRPKDQKKPYSTSAHPNVQHSGMRTAHQEMKRTTDPEEIWQQLKSSQTLDWLPCYPDSTTANDTFQCTVFLVPLNYSAPLSTTNQASIALIRIPSPYPPTSAAYKGPILFNPGGPGGSGVDLILAAGSTFRNILGPGFDLVGFDPRGVSRSRPFVSVFQTTLDRTDFISRQLAFFVVNASTNSIAEQVAAAHVIGQLAEITDVGGYLTFINTDHTARDMLSITKAHGRDQLQYWGFSYGSILGATFAAMFPNNVGRLVIDGVVDAEDYYSTSWTSGLGDTDKTMQSFFDSCYSAGPSYCPFHASSPSAISQNLNKIYDSLKARPISYVLNSGAFGVWDYNDLRWFISGSLYQPYALFPKLAVLLAGLSKGVFPNFNSTTNLNVVAPNEAQIAITCNDGQPIPGTVEDAEAHFNEARKLSEWADVWSGVRTLCSGWPKLPKFFRGPIEAKTSFPILLIGNTADPVTPLSGAKKMSKGFPGSVVLTQDSPGHTSLAGPSLCTANYVRAYFENGTLPKEGTICPVLGSPIPGPSGNAILDGQSLEELDDHELSLVDAVVNLSGKFSITKFL